MRTQNEMGTFRLTHSFTFEAAHDLPYHDGKESRLHGHSYLCRITVEGGEGELEDDGSKQGMMIDAEDLARPAKELCDEYLDHYYLNDTLDIESPTNEEIAQWIFDKLRGCYFGLLASVSVETPGGVVAEYSDTIPKSA